MKIGFATSSIEASLSSMAAMRRRYGVLAERIGMRMTSLAEYPNLAAIPKGKPFRCHALKGKDSGLYAIDINANWRLVFRPAVTGLPGDLHEDRDPETVTAIVIVDIIDYH